ncbi:uncharacterized protein BP5553_08433 [Venustampulla echinocandica]|uniref:Uncharacterized protein n=1 Tax=Venustampulla echinocandica TaxID=2656787 RepID=A0A370TE74_9HELO|nr:uncharacterized protein BP5553_08433 [Venustampulla echinocandica]RDL32994.1 hypothetical protein BP5553_08433 [Venustampulla echinocandica]
MPLQETGWRIKQFVSHRKAHSHGGASDYPNDQRYTDEKKLIDAPGRLSWLLQRSSEISSLQGHDSAATRKNCALPPANENTYSSASSLCSCDSCASPGLIEDSLSKAEPQPNPLGALYPPPLSPSITSNAKSWRFIFDEPLSPSQASIKFRTNIPSPDPEASLSSSNFPQLPTTQPAYEDKTPTQSIMSTEDPEIDYLSEEIDQLIRETDEAFKAVGTALENAKAATQGWYDTPEATAIKRSPIIARSPLKKTVPNKLPLVKGIPKKSVLATKASRRKSFKRRRTNILSRALKSVPPPPSKPSSRWTLTEVTTNMVDAFSGKMFRMEVDEMLSPGKMQQLREGFGHQNERKISLDSVCSADTLSNRISTEPFHPESLSSRIVAAKFVGPPFPSPVLPPPAIPRRKPVPPPGNKGTTVTKAELAADIVAKHSPRDQGILFDDLQFLTPPRDYHVKSSSSSGLLPSIPEFTPISLSPFLTFSKRLSQSRNQSHRGDPRYVFIPSTPFTLTSACFRHGPIRFEREQLMDIYHSRALNEYKGAEEEQLDWTAFQMAILGTMEENRTVNNEREQDEKECEDIFRWWAGFGFAGWGAMVTGSKGVRQRKIKKGIRRSTRDVGMKADEENDHEQSDDSVSSDSSSEGTGYPTMKKRLEINATPPTSNSNIATYITDPQVVNTHSGTRHLSRSPMPNFITTNNQKAEGRSATEAMPMGFNLERDLGDFLNWEVSHVQQPRWGDYEE